MRTVLFRYTLPAGLLICWWTFAAAPVSGEETPSGEEVLLKEHGIEPTPKGVTAYLAGLVPDATLRAEIDALIGQLGSDDFRNRETASRKLAAIWGARDALQLATRSSDAEVSYRARTILGESDRWRESVLLAALRYVRKEKPPGIVPYVVRMLPQCDQDYLRRAAVEALTATAGPSDLEALKGAVASNRLEVRLAGISALGRAVPDDAVVTLRPLLRDEAPAIRLATAEALIERLPRECLEMLPQLLECNELAIRTRSSRVLELVSGQQFGSVSDGSPQARAEIALKWRQWVDGPGRKAVLRVPLPTHVARRGRVLVCVNQEGGPNGAVPRLVEFDQLWQMSVVRDSNPHVSLPFGCQGLPDGHRLYTDWRTQAVIELDESGKEVWQQRVATGPASVERLENGNTLVAAYQSQRVVEVGRDGQTVWQLQVGGSVSSAHQLENGNILTVLNDQSRVVEFDRAGKAVWEVGNLPNPWSARRMPNGNTLVACNGGGCVLELTPDKRVQRTIDNLPNCFDADVLENGNVLAGYGQGLREVGLRGETIREHNIGMVRGISIY
jgi:hypothetical protein